MEMYPPKGGAPQFVETGVPVYPQPGASAPQYNHAFPGQAGVPPYNQAYQPFPPQAGVPPCNQAFPPQAGVPPHNQAFPGQINGASSEMEWSTGLCGCCEDPSNCCMTFWCPCVTVGQMVEVLDRGTTSCALGGTIYTALLCASILAGVPLTCLYSYGYRTKLRSLYSLKEGGCGDCCLHCWCEACALCQEHRELKIRGVDPALGWQGNVQKWNRDGSTAMPPAVATGMYR